MLTDLGAVELGLLGLQALDGFRIPMPAHVPDRPERIPSSVGESL